MMPGSIHLFRSEAEARQWLTGRPAAYCDTTDKKLLSNILPAFDQETPDFYRWQVVYTRQELEEIFEEKIGYRFWRSAKY